MIPSHLPTVIHSCARRHCLCDSYIFSMRIQCVDKSSNVFIILWYNYFYDSILFVALASIVYLHSIRSYTPTSMLWNGFMTSYVFFYMPKLISMVGVFMHSGCFLLTHCYWTHRLTRKWFTRALRLIYLSRRRFQHVRHILEVLMYAQNPTQDVVKHQAYMEIQVEGNAYICMIYNDHKAKAVNECIHRWANQEESQGHL